MPSLRRVLAVDDNPRNLAIIAKSLGNRFQLVDASSGEEALEISERYRPEAVLLDIMMPGLDGYETCRRLRESRTTRATKIIMVSARAGTSDRLEGYAAGADDFVTKPFDPDELVAKLEVYLRLKSAEEVNRVNSEMLTLLGHETRTPLTSILTPASLLADDPSLTVEQRQLAKIISDGGLRLLRLIERVTLLSELKSGSMPLATLPCEIEPLVNRAYAAVRASLARNDVHIEFEPNAALLFRGDSEMLQKAVESLLHNAVRLSPPAATILVAVQREGPWVTLTVADQGPGVPPAHMDRLFDEFSVTDVAHHTQGLGLGLAIARQIIELHGGRITAVNGAERGAEFTIHLPAHDAGRLAA